jgi:hypothetical protein
MNGFMHKQLMNTIHQLFSLVGVALARRVA